MVETVQARPMPGDVIRLDGYYWGATPGTLAVIDSSYWGDDGEVLATFGASAFRGPSGGIQQMIEDSMTGTRKVDGGDTVSCSGGPCPWVKLADLTPAGTHVQQFWKWGPRGRGAGNGVYYTLEVPLWSWKGQPNDLQRPAITA